MKRQYKRIPWKYGLIDVEFYYEPSCEGSIDLYGLKQEPDTPENIEIEDIRYNGHIVTNLFDENDFDLISEHLSLLLNEVEA